MSEWLQSVSGFLFTSDTSRQWILPFVTAAVPLLVAWLISYLRPARHLPNYEKTLRLIDDVSKGNMTDPLKKLLIEEAWAMLYSTRLSLRELDLLSFCDRRTEAVRAYCRYRKLLKISDDGLKFEFRSGVEPYRRWKKWNLSWAFLVGGAAYFVSMWLGLMLIKYLVRKPIESMGGDFIAARINATTFWCIAGLLIAFAIAALWQGIIRQQCDSVLKEALGDRFVSSRQ